MIILTDQEFTYRETPVSYDGLAKFESIKGNTIVENGSLVNFNATSIKTTGKNQLNTSDAVADAYVTLTKSNGTIKAVYDGTNSQRYRGFSLYKTSPYFNGTFLPKKYKLSFDVIGVDTSWSFGLRTVSGNLFVTGSRIDFTHDGHYSGTIDATALSENCYISASRIGNITTSFELVFTNIQLEIGETETVFEEYKTESETLPISTYFPTGMKSAGSVYDELTPSKAITRVGTRAYQNGDENDPSVITDGINTNYALQTPTETDGITIEYNFYKGGTEQILPSTSAPILANIIYYNLTEGDTPYRKFWMINAKGERWNMAEREEKSFLNDPQGLGYAKTISVIRYGNKQNLTDVTDNFPQPTGEILFYDSANSSRYERYNDLVRFLSYYPITLYYQLPVSYYSHMPTTYSLDCVVSSLTKTESKADGLLRCSIAFDSLSFYKGETVEISGSGSTYTITNDGDFPVGFEITIEGSPVNPYVQLEQDNELYGEAKFIDSTAFDSLYINSNDGEQNVILEQGGSVLPNPLSYQDLSISNGSIYVTFVKLARGESDLTIGMDSGSLTSVEIKFTPFYRSV